MPPQNSINSNIPASLKKVGLKKRWWALIFFAGLVTFMLCLLSLVPIIILFITLHFFLKTLFALVNLEREIKITKINDTYNQPFSIVKKFLRDSSSWLFFCFGFSFIASFLFLAFCDSGPINACYQLSYSAGILSGVSIIFPILSWIFYIVAKKSMNIKKLNTAFILMSIPLFFAPVSLIVWAFILI